LLEVLQPVHVTVNTWGVVLQGEAVKRWDQPQGEMVAYR